MLAGSGLGDDAFFPEPLGHEDLAQRVVDLVRAGVEQVLALKVDFRAAEQSGPAFREIQRRGTADVVVQQTVEFRVESGIGLGLLILVGQLAEGEHERLRHKHAAEISKVSVRVREGGGRGKGVVHIQ